MADERIEISVSRADWDKMSPDQRADFTFSALQYLVCATKESKFRNSFLAVAGGGSRAAAPPAEAGWEEF